MSARIVAHGHGAAPGRIWEVVAAVHLLSARRADPVTLAVAADGPEGFVRHPVEEYGFPVELGEEPDVEAADVQLVADDALITVITPDATVELGPGDGPSVLADLLELLLGPVALR